MSTPYTLEEVAKHNKENDLWIIIHNGIYDLTKFLKEHPGGEEVLTGLAGGDGSDCFDAIGHSMEAVQLREGYKIGDLAETDTKKIADGGSGVKVTTSTQNVADEEPWDYVEHKEENSPWILVFLGLAFLVYAIIFYYIF